MIKLPKEINRILQALEEKKYEVYVTGDCVYQGLLGQTAKEWDLCGNAPIEVVAELVTGFIAVDETYGYANLSEELILEFSKTDSLTRHLSEAGFTIQAMADNPNRTFQDPSEGKSDLSKKLIKSVGDANARFEQDPLLILEGIRLAGELDFDIEMSTYLGMEKAVCRLEATDKKLLREAFGEILTSAHGAKALRMAMAIGVMTYIFGEKRLPLRKGEARDFQTLMENLDKCRPDLQYRYAVLFLCLETKRGEEAILELGFRGRLKEKLLLAQKVIPEFHFVSEPLKFKQFLFRYGMDNYNYLEDVSKQQRKIYDHAENRILSRAYMLEEFKKNKMPVFLEDLAINEDDLEAAGIAAGEEATQLLAMLMDMIHVYPGKNQKTLLLKKAKQIKKNPLMRSLRGVQWMK